MQVRCRASRAGLGPVSWSMWFYLVFTARFFKPTFLFLHLKQIGSHSRRGLAGGTLTRFGLVVCLLPWYLLV